MASTKRNGQEGEGLIRGRRSFKESAHQIYKKDIEMLSTCVVNQTMRTVIITEE